MATSSSVQTSSTASDSIIAGYFQTGEDAHRAINALLDEGFLASQIGAAFHTSGLPQEATNKSNASEELGTRFNEEAGDIDTSAGGPMSGTEAVQPVGLSSGSGSVILGAGAPGPIPGSNLQHSGLPSELHSELAHDQAGSAPHLTVPAYTADTSLPRQAAKADTSWTAKLKHLFQPKQTAASDGDSQKFGTGEGHLNLPSPYGRPYSRTAFEGSVSDAGVPVEHSRHLSHRLSTGGAVVTVNDTGRSIEVEKIFERHNGVVRFASDIFNDSPALDYEPRVEVFGHLEHRYPLL